MKILIWSLLICTMACSPKKKSGLKEVLDKPKISFKEENFDFGEISEGKVVSTTYEFENTGTMPLQITGVDVSCGCTVAEKPEQPVGVGKTGAIKVSFNSTGKVGVNKKNVTVHSNASNSPTIVSFDVVVNKIEQ